MDKALLDTDIFSEILKGIDQNVVAKAIGMPVEVVFERVNEEITLPKFRPARDTRSTIHDA